MLESSGRSGNISTIYTACSISTSSNFFRLAPRRDTGVFHANILHPRKLGVGHFARVSELKRLSDVARYVVKWLLTLVFMPQSVLPFEAVTPSMMTWRSALSLQLPQFLTNDPNPSASKPLIESYEHINVSTGSFEEIQKGLSYRACTVELED